LRVAVIGVGYLGKHHARILSSLPGVDLVAVVDTNRPRAEEIAASSRTQPAFESRDLLGRVDAVKQVVPAGTTLPQFALRFILQNPTVATVIPGMRKTPHVLANVAVSDGTALPASVMAELRRHRWDRKPAPWSD